MTRNEKKTAIENMAERFMSISDLEGKSMAIERHQSGFENQGTHDNATEKQDLS